MTDQKSSDVAVTNAVKIYYEKRILKDFEPKTVFYSQAPVKQDIPQNGGKTIEFTRYLKIPALYADNSTEFSAQQMYLSAKIVQATLHERDGYVQLSKYLDLTAISKPLDQAADKVQAAGAKTLDKLVRNDIGFCVADKAVYSAGMFNDLKIDGGRLNSSGITARLWTRRSHGFPIYHNKTRVAQSALVTSIAKTGLTVKTVQAGVNVLNGQDVEPMSDGMFRLITHPSAAYQITTQAGFKGWFSPTTAQPVKTNPMEVGVIAGTRIMSSTLAYRYPLSGDTMSTASGALFASLLFGNEAYGCSQISSAKGKNGFEFFLKQSGPQSTNDPTNKIRQASFSVLGVGKVLNKSAGLWILTTEQV